MRTLSTTFSGTGPATFAKAADGTILVCNGYQRPLRWDGLTTSAELAGISAPPEAPTVVPGTITTAGGIWGTYYGYSRFVDDSGVPSNLSPVTLVDIDKVNRRGYLAIDIDPSDEARVARTEFWRSTSGQNNTIYLDLTTATSGMSYMQTVKNDCDLKTCEALRILTEAGYPNANRFALPPSWASVVIAHKDRLWFLVPAVDGYSAYRNAIAWSEVGEPESVPAVNTAYVQDDNGSLVGGVTAHGCLYVFTRTRVYRIGTSGDPRRDLTINPVAYRGCINHRCCVQIEDKLFLMDEFGAYGFNGSSVQSATTEIQDVWWDRINWEYSALFWGAYDGTEETVKFFVSLDTDGPALKHALCCHMRSGQWWIEDYPYSLTAGTPAIVTGKIRLLAASSAVWVLGAGVYDGPGNSAYFREDSSGWLNVRGTIAALTTTYIETDDAFPPVSALENPGLIGAPLWIETKYGVQQVLISSFTTTRIYYSGDFANPLPAVGDTYQIGGIRWRVKLGAFTFAESERSTPRRLHLHFEPLVAGTVYVRVYPDYSTAASPAAITYDNEAGVKVESGADCWRVDLSQELGYGMIALDDGFESRGPASRIVEVELEGVQPRERVKIYGLDIDGVLPPSGTS